MPFCVLIKERRVFWEFSVSAPHLTCFYFFSLYSAKKLLSFKNIRSYSPDLHGIFIYVVWMAAYNPYNSEWISQNWRQSMARSIMEISFFLCIWRELLEPALLPWALCLCLYKKDVSLDSSGGPFSPLLDWEAKRNVTSGSLCQRSPRDCLGWSWERCCWPVRSRELTQMFLCTSWLCCRNVQRQRRNAKLHFQPYDSHLNVYHMSKCIYGMCCPHSTNSCCSKRQKALENHH